MKIGAIGVVAKKTAAGTDSSGRQFVAPHTGQSSQLVVGSTAEMMSFLNQVREAVWEITHAFKAP